MSLFQLYVVHIGIAYLNIGQHSGLNSLEMQAYVLRCVRWWRGSFLCVCLFGAVGVECFGDEVSFTYNKIIYTFTATPINGLPWNVK